MNALSCQPIGTFHSQPLKKYDLPRQGVDGGPNVGKIVLSSGSNFEQALQGLEGFERIWVLFWFDQTKGWHPKVLPPRGGKKQGVFATRSPHRPNPLGLSCVKLMKIQGRELQIEGHDLLDGTPILDIKPYVEYADSFSGQKQGWLEEVHASEKYKIIWSALAEEQAEFLKEKAQLLFQEKIFYSLENFSGPSPYNRIKWLEGDLFEMGYKSWRFVCRRRVSTLQIEILYLRSGYDEPTLRGEKTTRWQDVDIHREFMKFFTSKISLESKDYLVTQRL